VRYKGAIAPSFELWRRAAENPHKNEISINGTEAAKGPGDTGTQCPAEPAAQESITIPCLSGEGNFELLSESTISGLSKKSLLAARKTLEVELGVLQGIVAAEKSRVHAMKAENRALAAAKKAEKQAEKIAAAKLKSEARKQAKLLIAEQRREERRAAQLAKADEKARKLSIKQAAAEERKTTKKFKAQRRREKRQSRFEAGVKLAASQAEAFAEPHCDSQHLVDAPLSMTEISKNPGAASCVSASLEYSKLPREAKSGFTHSTRTLSRFAKRSLAQADEMSLDAVLDQEMELDDKLMKYLDDSCRSEVFNMDYSWSPDILSSNVELIDLLETRDLIASDSQ
jgi:hypothetical protein